LHLLLIQHYRFVEYNGAMLIVEPAIDNEDGSSRRTVSAASRGFFTFRHTAAELRPEATA
jgi:hypothetical protein